jgi:hypothetical protein
MEEEMVSLTNRKELDILDGKRGRKQVEDSGRYRKLPEDERCTRKLFLNTFRSFALNGFPSQ